MEGGGLEVVLGRGLFCAPPTAHGGKGYWRSAWLRRGSQTGVRRAGASAGRGFAVLRLSERVWAHADALLAARGCDIGSGGVAAGRRRGGKNDNVKGGHCSAALRRGSSVRHSPCSRGSDELAIVCCSWGRDVFGARRAGRCRTQHQKFPISKSPPLPELPSPYHPQHPNTTTLSGNPDLSDLVEHPFLIILLACLILFGQP